MFHPSVLADFMYFPKDKSDYIPALISFSIFFIGAIITMRFIIAHSKREAKKAKELEEKLNIQNNQKEQ
ncbi:hypothetical protein NDK43_00470 [Neobacillus pocheonensis]|uniref:Uncharacterized protein n=1 Tax=Neobacillus pocheonensis TaxID=363869 RepID=A0ABT0W4C9_9BACI|nr:hypothetical protein [Neobacillus pocheonensis]